MRKKQSQPVTPETQRPPARGPRPTIPDLPTDLPSDVRVAFNVLDAFEREHLDFQRLNDAWNAYVAGLPADEVKVLLDTEGEDLTRRRSARVAEIRERQAALLIGFNYARTEKPETEFDRVYESAYGSQGLGAMKYATGSAELTADRLRSIGLSAVVEQIKIPGTRREVYAAKVLVDVDPADMPMLKRAKVSVSLVDEVAACWRRGLNPRVYNPYLSHGFEERHGIGWDGRINNGGGAHVQ